MAFPLSHSGTFRVEPDVPVSADELLARFSHALEAERAGGLVRSGETVAFQGSMLRGVRGGLLRLVGEGWLRVVPENGRMRVAWKITYTPLLLASLLFLILPGVLLYAEPSIPAAPKAGMLIMLWVWMVGLNYVLSSLRFRRFVRRQLTGTVKAEMR